MARRAYDICRHLYVTLHSAAGWNLPYWYSQRGESSQPADYAAVRHFPLLVASSSQRGSESVRVVLFIRVNPYEFTRILPKRVFKLFLKLPSSLWIYLFRPFTFISCDFLVPRCKRVLEVMRDWKITISGVAAMDLAWEVSEFWKLEVLREIFLLSSECKCLVESCRKRSDASITRKLSSRSAVS